MLELEEGGNMGERGNDTAQVCVVDDILGSIGGKHIVNGDRVETLRHAGQIYKPRVLASKQLR
jgi:hypothetical protein